MGSQAVAGSGPSREARDHDPSALGHRLAAQSSNPLGNTRDLGRKHRALADKVMIHLQLPRTPDILVSGLCMQAFTLRHRFQSIRLLMQHFCQRRELNVERKTRPTPAQLPLPGGREGGRRERRCSQMSSAIFTVIIAIVAIAAIPTNTRNRAR